MSVFAAVLAAALSVPASAELKTRAVEYRIGETVLEGWLAFDDSFKGSRPGVLVFPDWKGHGPYARKRAEQLAGMGYIAFAADMYGKGVYAKDRAEAAALAGALRKDGVLMRARAKAAYEALLEEPRVAASKTAAIGYCFGGGVVLEMARAGLPLSGVVSFHGSFDTTQPAGPGDIKARILVLHGAEDKNMAQAPAFLDELRRSGADWQFVQYSGAVHAFTQPESGNDPSKGAAYDEKADRRSWQAMKDFFAELFGS